MIKKLLLCWTSVIYATLFLSLTIAKECVKIDQCSCEMDDGSGTIDIRQIGKPPGEPPLLKDVPVSAGSVFSYSFNPCIPFDEGTCENVAGCQIDARSREEFDIGAADQVKFSFDETNNYLVGTYDSSDTDRSSIVNYICDPSVDTPQASVQGEIEPLTYHFSIVSKYACPNEAPIKVNCSQLDQCSCRFDDGRGIVDLTGLGKHGTPFIFDVQAEHYYYSFNPCFSFTEGTCQNVAGCQIEKNSSIYIDIAAAFPMSLSYDGNNVVGYYTSGDGSRNTIVTYVCNLAVDQPIVIVHGEICISKYVFTIVSKELCPKNETTASSDVIAIKVPRA